MIKRFDYLFSYWLLGWYILYELKIIKYNPKIGLILAVIVNLLELLIMFYYNYNRNYIILFILINFTIKLIPLWRLKNKKTGKRDINMLIYIFIIYIIWLVYNKINISDMNFIEDIKNNKPFSPLLYYLTTK